jgi:hypothetical protein
MRLVFAFPAFDCSFSTSFVGSNDQGMRLLPVQNFNRIIYKNNQETGSFRLVHEEMI